MQASQSSVKEVLKGMEYHPAEKRDLVKHARLHGASGNVLDGIKNFQDKVYTSTSYVNKELENK